MHLDYIGCEYTSMSGQEWGKGQERERVEQGQETKFMQGCYVNSV